MPVDSINGYGSDLPIRSTSARSAAPASASSAAPDSLDTTAAFQAAQNQTASSRPDKIARATALLSDPGYPSAQTLNQLAGYLANKL